ncbi:CDP-alcohol phosphatidyltransferase family protein [Shimia biformata]|uniref:CDP-alcohol phosphatidyltransferase family protein n=1 Tax=Shimia biformata TaxID=1294299 RepID=UPI0019504C27|nr:CDP-alcohol phosphatidyltransferase family protein [Shimia biformata]
MADRTQYSLAEIRRSHPSDKARNEWQTEWALSLLYRRPGFIVAWALLRLGFNANHATAASLVLTLLMPFAALAMPIEAAAVMVFWLAVTHQILDCADGSMARVTGTAGAAGARFDFLVDMLHWGLLYLSLGLLADAQFNSGWTWTAVALFAGWLRLFARVCRDSTPTPPPTADAPAPPFIVMAVSGLNGLIPLLPVAGDHLHWAVLFITVFSVLDLADSLPGALR